MKKAFGLIAVLVVLASVVKADPISLVGPDPTPEGNPDRVKVWLTTKHNPTSGLMGLHLDRAANDGQPHGVSLDLDGKPVWETDAIDFEWPDLILAYSHTLKADNFRLRSDTAQIEIGQRCGHPITPFQMHITAGNEQEPLGGLALATYGYQYSLYMYNRSETTKRTNVNFNNIFSWCTDSTNTGTPDFYLHNYQDNTNPITVSESSQIGLNGALAHSGPAVGFYGAAPIARPTITGSRSDGTALANLLSQLSALGLVVDNTTP